ncbi:MAG: acetyl-CoA carboxylase, biotin carboxyl carrier protein [Alphaproteobacteria bacterium]|nr:acetyl-CoA carboxylase, biotin carboxyl carrier protein [Alphaproteobacteria bacterium]
MSKGVIMEDINKKAVSDLSELLKLNGLREIEYEAENVRIRVVANYAEQPVVAAPVVAAPQVSATVPSNVAEDKDKANYVKSPMVGVVYLASDPSAANFVKEGDLVGVGQTLCLIEAMKTFNPVKAEKAGCVKKVLVQSGMPVEFNEPLFVIE